MKFWVLLLYVQLWLGFWNGAAFAETDSSVSTQANTLASVAPIVIDVGVGYTPESRQNEGAGTTADILTRITTAIAGANQIYKDSGINISFNLVKAFEFPKNNTSTSVFDGINVTSLEYEELRPVYGVDTLATIVAHLDEGAYANIPITPGNAITGGSMIFGRSNFCNFTLTPGNHPPVFHISVVKLLSSYLGDLPKKVAESG